MGLGGLVVLGGCDTSIHPPNLCTYDLDQAIIVSYVFQLKTKLKIELFEPLHSNAVAALAASSSSSSRHCCHPTSTGHRELATEARLVGHGRADIIRRHELEPNVHVRTQHAASTPSRDQVIVRRRHTRESESEHVRGSLAHQVVVAPALQCVSGHTPREVMRGSVARLRHGGLHYLLFDANLTSKWHWQRPTLSQNIGEFAQSYIKFKKATSLRRSRILYDSCYIILSRRGILF